MSTVTQLILIASIIAVVPLFNLLEELHVPFGLIYFTVPFTILGLIVWMPDSFKRWLMKQVHDPKNPHSERSDINRGLRFMLLKMIFTFRSIFWGFLTRYYPFSRLYRDRLIHADNLSLRNFIHELEQYSEDIHLSFSITGGDPTGDMTFLNAVQSENVKMKKDEYLSRLLEKLQEKYVSIYISPRDRGFQICIPTEMIKKRSK